MVTEREISNKLKMSIIGYLLKHAHKCLQVVTKREISNKIENVHYRLVQMEVS